MPRVLLVTKRPQLERYDGADLDRLAQSGIDRREALIHGQESHHQALAVILQALAHVDLRTRRVDELTSGDADSCDLVVTAGGDGTVLAIQPLLRDQPVLSVNSDPQRSLGHFTRFNADEVADAIANWRAGSTTIHSIPRLAVHIDDGASVPVLNDCLITNANAAAMSRYVLEVGEQREEQSSSGLWVSTAAGSTGGIASAGAEPVRDGAAALLYHVREPFQARQKLALLSGVQCPPQGIRVIPTIPGMTCYVDGGHLFQLDAPPGAVISVGAHGQPLQLLSREA